MPEHFPREVKQSREAKRSGGEAEAMKGEEEVVIVGGGIAGLATALALQRVGVRSLVLERSDELRATGAGISLFPNAWRALDALGVADKLAPLYPQFFGGRVTNIVTGATQETSFTGTGRDPMGVRTVHRKILLEALAEELLPGTIRFSSRLVSVQTEILEDSSARTLLLLEDGDVIRTKVLIGCDGVHSVVAQWLGLASPINSGRSAVRGMAVFPDGHGFKKEVQQFLGPDKRAGFVPLNEKDLYWFIVHKTIPGERETSLDPHLIKKDVLQNLAKDFPPAYIQVVRNSDLSTVTWAPLMYRAPWNILLGPTHKGCVVVAGDAFHPMTPDLGQGGGSSLEDAVVLVRSIVGMLGHVARRGAWSPKKVEEGINAYIKERRWRAARLITGAFLFGWVQQDGKGWCWWVVKLFRDIVFNRFVYPIIVDAVRYDCGDLPTVV